MQCIKPIEGIDEQRVARAVECTRFPIAIPPKGEEPDEVSKLVRAAGHRRAAPVHAHPAGSGRRRAARRRDGRTALHHALRPRPVPAGRPVHVRPPAARHGSSRPHPAARRRSAAARRRGRPAHQPLQLLRVVSHIAGLPAHRGRLHARHASRGPADPARSLAHLQRRPVAGGVRGHRLAGHRADGRRSRPAAGLPGHRR